MILVINSIRKPSDEREDEIITWYTSNWLLFAVLKVSILNVVLLQLKIAQTPGEIDWKVLYGVDVCIQLG